MIGFSAPWVLAGLAAAVIPIVLHLAARREPPVVPFPAVRYLEDTARRHQRRLRLRDWLLLVVRTLLIALLVAAAAGPSWSGPFPGGGRAPAAAVIVLDNSLSAGAVRDGEPTIEILRRAAAAVLDRATPANRIWLLSADGVSHGGDPAELRAIVESLAVTPRRLDLGEALTAARALLGTTALPGEVVLLTDLQATALSAAEGASPLLIGMPEPPTPPNWGVADVELGPQPWLGSGRVAIRVVGREGDTVAATVAIGDRLVRQTLLVAGGTAALALPSLPPGWHSVTVQLTADELRGDDIAVAAVRVASPAAVTWDPADRYLDAAAEVLRANGRLRSGAELTLGRLGPGIAVVPPPADPAELGALNRTLAARGAAWRFGEMVTRPGRTDSAAVLTPVAIRRRHHLVPAGGTAGDVLVRVGGDPWMVRTGEVLLIGSRFDPDWTELPLTAGYMPFMDVLINRLARGEVPSIAGVPGEAITVPSRITAILTPAGERQVGTGGRFIPEVTGLHWLMDRGDTAGVLAVNPDPRESRLAVAEREMVRGLWPEARIEPAERVAGLAFRHGAAADLRGPLMAVILVLALAEWWLGRLRRRGNPP